VLSGRGYDSHPDKTFSRSTCLKKFRETATR